MFIFSFAIDITLCRHFGCHYGFSLPPMSHAGAFADVFFRRHFSDEIFFQLSRHLLIQADTPIRFRHISPVFWLITPDISPPPELPLSLRDVTVPRRLFSPLFTLASLLSPCRHFDIVSPLPPPNAAFDCHIFRHAFFVSPAFHAYFTATIIDFLLPPALSAIFAAIIFRQLPLFASADISFIIFDDADAGCHFAISYSPFDDAGFFAISHSRLFFSCRQPFSPGDGRYYGRFHAFCRFCRYELQL
jgi:hypothetical protein